MCGAALRKRPPRDMTADEFAEILERLPRLEEVNIQGVGEVFLNPHLDEILSVCASRKLLVWLNTNASLLNEKNIEMIRGRVSLLNISLDTVDDKLFKKIRVGGKLDTVLSNIENTVRLLDQSGRGARMPRLQIVICVMKRNKDGIPDVIKYASKTGIDSVFVLASHTWGETADGSGLGLGLHDGGGPEKNVFRLAREAARKYNVALTLPAEVNALSAPCSPSGYVTVEGFVTPCCILANPDTIHFGNVFEKDINEIINSGEFARFRKKLALGIYQFRTCRTCRNRIAP